MDDTDVVNQLSLECWPFLLSLLLTFVREEAGEDPLDETISPSSPVDPLEFPFLAPMFGK